MQKNKDYIRLLLLNQDVLRLKDRLLQYFIEI